MTVATNSNNPDVRELQVQYEHIDEKLGNLQETVEQGFEGVHDRQDVTNGKVMRHEQNIQENAERIGEIQGQLNNLEDNFVDHRLDVKQDKIDKLSEWFNRYKSWILGVFGSIITGVVVYLITSGLL